MIEQPIPPRDNRFPWVKILYPWAFFGKWGFRALIMITGCIWLLAGFIFLLAQGYGAFPEEIPVLAYHVLLGLGVLSIVTSLLLSWSFRQLAYQLAMLSQWLMLIAAISLVIIFWQSGVSDPLTEAGLSSIQILSYKIIVLILVIGGPSQLLIGTHLSWRQVQTSHSQTTPLTN
jgi:hypothetical protein